MGIEKPQLEAIGELYQKGPASTPPFFGLYNPAGKTPNQRAQAVGLGLAVARLWPQRYSPRDAEQAVAAFFADMNAVGHQAVDAERFDGNEQGAPDPHAELWGAGMAMGLREARIQKLPHLTLYLIWWAEHLALCREFWTPAGVRMPCARALSLPPQWVWDSRAYALIALREDGQGAKAKYGNIAPPAQPAFEVLRDSASLFADIYTRSKAVELKLASPIRRWRLEGAGFVAAFDKDSPAIDAPMGWCRVAPGGAIATSDRLLDTFTPPAGAPDLVGGPGGTVVLAVQPTTTAGGQAATPVSPAPAPRVVPGAGLKPRPSLWQRFLAWLRSL